MERDVDSHARRVKSSASSCRHHRDPFDDQPHELSGLDEEMASFRARRLDHLEFPYLFADATFVKGRIGGQVVSRAVVAVTGVTANGEREVLGCAVGDTECEDF